ncbi:MAG: sugar transporter [Pseudomonadota bacterium]
MTNETKDPDAPEKEPTGDADEVVVSHDAAPVFVRPAEGEASRMLEKLQKGTALAAAQGRALAQTPESLPSHQGTAEAVAAPAVPAARLRGRHWGLIVSFVLFVVAPAAVTAWYLWEVAEDQFHSIAAFTVRQDEGQGASDLIGGLAALAGGNTGGDSEILYEFIQSQALIERIDADLDIRGHYSALYDADPVFALKPDASIEDLVSYWSRVVRVIHEQGAGLLEVEVRAFDAPTARAIATQIVSYSQDMINDLNIQAREDAMQFARDDLDQAVARLSAARAALTEFRSRTQIVDPVADIQGRMGVMNNLQQQLAEALIEFDLLTENANNANDPRIAQGQLLIDVIRERIAREREALANGDENTISGDDYPQLIAEFEALVVEREFTEENYRAALAAMEVARADIIRQSRYLATYVPPTLAETPEYPQREVLLGLVTLFAFLSWAVGCLIIYSIRDRG